MIFFDEATLRLKQLVKLTSDKDVADLLGLSPRAWAGRRKRNSFPEKELWALAAKRNDIDIEFVLKGDQGVDAAPVLDMNHLRLALKVAQESAVSAGQNLSQDERIDMALVLYNKNTGKQMGKAEFLSAMLKTLLPLLDGDKKR